MRRLTPGHMQHRLARIGYRYDRLVARKASDYHALILELCGRDALIAALIRDKQPSTGLAALAVGLELGRWQRFVMAGFDFTLTHAYGENPLLSQRGDASSKHADTDIAILRCLARNRTDIFTTEGSIHDLTGLAWLPGAEQAARTGKDA